MTDISYNKTTGNTSNVQDKLKLFPEVHMYKTEPGPNSRTPAKKKETKKLERIFLVIIIFLIAVVALELVFHFIISPRLTIRKITVRAGTNVPLSSGEVMRLAGLEGELFYFSINTEEITKLLTSYPLIKTAVVEKKFPDSLTIDLTGRDPLAVSIVDTGEGAVPVVFDEEGVVFQVGTSITDFDNLVISGIIFKNIQLGMKLPEELLELLSSLYGLKTESPELFRLLSEVKIIKRSNNQYEAVMFFTGYQMPVRTGMRLTINEMKYILMILDVVTIKDLQDRIQELDLRSGEVVYKVKEVLSGE